MIFDPQEKHTISAETHHMKCDYSAYEGWQVKGKVRTVLCGGRSRSTTGRLSWVKVWQISSAETFSRDGLTDSGEKSKWPRKVKVGLIQMACKLPTEKSCDEHRRAMTEAHLPLIDEAGRRGVNMLCMQEVFTGPYFCPSQDVKWYGLTEKVPDGPTTQLMQEYAKKHGMVIVVPIYEEQMTGVYYNTAAVIDADGKYLGKYRKNHIPQVKGFWEKFFFKPGNLGYPVFKTAFGNVGVYICYDGTSPMGRDVSG